MEFLYLLLDKVCRFSGFSDEKRAVSNDTALKFLYNSFVKNSCS